MTKSNFTKYLLGDSCLCWSVGQEIHPRLVRLVLSVYTTLKSDSSLKNLGVRDLVPSYTALAVHFDPLAAGQDDWEARIDELFTSAREAELETWQSPQVWTLPVVYDGPDMERLSRLHNLTIAEIIRRHIAPRYLVAMIGFKPHFPYLVGLDKILNTPRLDSPRKSVPAGSVGIGGAQTGIYPMDSPGGWNIIGRTDPALLTKIEPGHSLIFQEVSSI